jgi:hypothetical protein
MSRTVEHVTFKGRGPVRYAPTVKPDNLRRLGNNSELDFSVASSEETMEDYEGEGGGAADSDAPVTGVTLGMNLLQRTAETQALGLRGVVSEAPTEEQTDELHHAYPGALTLLSYNPDKLETFTVEANGGTWAASTAYVAETSLLMASFLVDGDHIYECTVAGISAATPEPTWPTNGATVEDGTVTWIDRGDISSLVAGTDFNISSGGFTVPATGSAIVAGMPIKCTYTPHANQALIEGLKDSGTEYRVVFDGMNRMRDNRPCVIECRRVKFNPTEGTKFISDTFGEMPISATLLKDETVSADSNMSQYFTVRWQDAA